MILGTGWKYGESSGQAIIKLTQDEINKGLLVMGENYDEVIRVIMNQTKKFSRILIGDIGQDWFNGITINPSQPDCPSIDPFVFANDGGSLKRVIKSMVINKSEIICKNSINKILSFYIDSIMLSIQEYGSEKVNLIFDEIYDFITNCEPPRLSRQLDQMVMRPAINLNNEMKRFIEQHKRCCLDKAYEHITDSLEKVNRQYRFSCNDEITGLIKSGQDIHITGEDNFIKIMFQILLNIILNGKERNVMFFISVVSPEIKEFLRLLKQEGIFYSLNIRKIDTLFDGMEDVSDFFYTKIFTRAGDQSTAVYMVTSFNEYRRNLPYIFINYGGKELDDPDIRSVSEMGEKDILVIKGSNNAFQGRLIEYADDLQEID